MPAGGGEHEDATLRLVIETLKRGSEGTQQIYIKQVVGRPLDLHGRHKTLIKYEVPGRVEVAVRSRISVERLMRYMRRLDYDVTIRFEPKPASREESTSTPIAFLAALMSRIVRYTAGSGCCREKRIPCLKSLLTLGVKIFNHTLDPSIVLARLVRKVEADPIEQPVVSRPQLLADLIHWTTQAEFVQHFVGYFFGHAPPVSSSDAWVRVEA